MSDVANPRGELAFFIDQLHVDYEAWYAKATRSTYRWYLAMQVIAILASFSAAAIAAMTEIGEFTRWVKAAVVVLPLISGLAASAIVQFKLYDMWRLREDGRIQFQGLVTEGRQRLAAAATDADVSEIHKDLQQRAQTIEMQQGANFFGLFSASYVIQYVKPNP
ncbi:hypothetical protein FZO89_00930 [Luteimonas viscosa]|uniref:SMODS and SLOG-associating 2TM effector domain-containing protein n=1 Tax=Luteimonas viscosa TaxID=1132694 RepID=A0A5D4XJV3_9GAMM|nr:hypothetical protein [Luteimonas viscosa]TYT24957.1 hypothetical protein FZO89_00930 [Luteimonas viscosa]